MSKPQTFRRNRLIDFVKMYSRVLDELEASSGGKHDPFQPEFVRGGRRVLEALREDFSIDDTEVSGKEQ